MTAQQPQQEYIIDGNTIKIAREECVRAIIPDWDGNCDGCKYYKLRGTSENACCDFDDNEILKLLHSRPHHSERDKVLDDLGKILNTRIAKMEILNSKNPSPFRKGIIEAYRDIEMWELAQNHQTKAGEP